MHKIADLAKRTSARRAKKLLTLVACATLTACGASNPPRLSDAHLKPVVPINKDIPTATQLPVLSPPMLAPKQETYTVVVNEVPVKELLFSVARDAKLNIDIHPGIHGTVTLNAVQQTLPQILDRIAKQVDLRYQLDGPNLVLAPDDPYWRIYPVDYVNMSRDSSSEVNVATQIATTGGSVTGGSGSSGNRSNTTVKNTSDNHFWELLSSNIREILDISTEASAPAAAPATPTAPVATATVAGANPTPAAPIAQTAEAAPAAVVINPVSGIISVRATQRQHQQVQAFLDLVLTNAQRQVLIEMTIVEVELSDKYQAGVDWSRLAGGDGSGSNGPSISSGMLGTNLSTAPAFKLGYNNSDISFTLKLLETFGDVKVLSSPKIMALNNQTALLKVVDESVYFTVEQETTQTEGQPSITTFTSQVHTVPVGLVMSVMPQINKNNQVTLNVRPTISRITSFKEDPVPKLAGINFENLIPQIQVREMESLLTVTDGQTIVMGGLMQNKVQKIRNAVPGLGDTPYIGDLFAYRNEELTKTELVLFLRPTIIKNGGLNLDMTDYNRYLNEFDANSAKAAGKKSTTVTVTQQQPNASRVE